MRSTDRDENSWTEPRAMNSSIDTINAGGERNHNGDVAARKQMLDATWRYQGLTCYKD